MSLKESSIQFELKRQGFDKKVSMVKFCKYAKAKTPEDLNNLWLFSEQFVTNYGEISQADYQKKFPKHFDESNSEVEKIELLFDLRLKHTHMLKALLFEDIAIIHNVVDYEKLRTTVRSQVLYLRLSLKWDAPIYQNKQDKLINWAFGNYEEHKKHNEASGENHDHFYKYLHQTNDFEKSILECSHVPDVVFNEDSADIGVFVASAGLGLLLPMKSKLPDQLADKLETSLVEEEKIKEPEVIEDVQNDIVIGEIEQVSEIQADVEIQAGVENVEPIIIEEPIIEEPIIEEPVIVEEEGPVPSYPEYEKTEGLLEDDHLNRNFLQEYYKWLSVEQED